MANEGWDATSLGQQIFGQVRDSALFGSLGWRLTKLSLVQRMQQPAAAAAAASFYRTRTQCHPTTRAVDRFLHVSSGVSAFGWETRNYTILRSINEKSPHPVREGPSASEIRL